jgi:hypothetical protein
VGTGPARAHELPEAARAVRDVTDGGEQFRPAPRWPNRPGAMPPGPPVVRPPFSTGAPVSGSAPWCSGQACWPLEPATAVRIRSGLL